MSGYSQQSMIPLPRGDCLLSPQPFSVQGSELHARKQSLIAFGHLGQAGFSGTEGNVSGRVSGQLQEVTRSGFKCTRSGVWIHLALQFYDFCLACSSEKGQHKMGK